MLQFQKKMRTTLRKEKFKPKCVDTKRHGTQLTEQRYWYTANE